MLFCRYSNPYLLIDTLIKSNSLRKGLLDIIKIKDEESMWEMYCSLLSNPMNKIKSFKEFKNKMYGGKVNKTEPLRKTLKGDEVLSISNKSDNILKNFKPR